MRKLTDHIVSGDQSHQLTVEALDGPEPGNASHDYVISGFNTTLNPSSGVVCGDKSLRILFQNGPIKEAGVNGISHESLLTILIDRMRGFQAGQYSCRENAIALTHLEESLMWLQKRTVARIKRGVEGTHEK